MSEPSSVVAMRRKLLRLLIAGVAAVPLTSFAQKKPAKIYRVGVLVGGGSGPRSPWLEALMQGLRERGYVEGQNLVMERRGAQGKYERLPELAADLVRMKMDVIVANNDLAIAAAKRATQTIPIVMVSSTDPVATGFVASLARPGDNITGISTMSPELTGKRLELLREVVPGLSKVAILWNPNSRGVLVDYIEAEKAARALRLQFQSVEIVRTEDLEQAYAAIRKSGAQALIVAQGTAVALANRDQVVSFALKNRLPSVYGIEEFVQAGGLMSYGSNSTERWRRAATFVDKILKGTKPADLPVEQPTRFELVINVKTAKALGLTIPPTVMVRADRVIE